MTGIETHISLEQKASGDFYGQYFWKDYTVDERSHFDFIVDKIGDRTLATASSLLDIGSGSGKFAILLKHHYPHLKVTALDLSPDNLASIKRNAGEVEVETCNGSALELPFEHNSFDIVLCPYMLQHTLDPKLGFLESARVLKVGGTSFYAIGCENGLGWVHRKTRPLFSLVPASLRRATVYPLVPLYWALNQLIDRKASKSEPVMDLVDWVFNPLQHFVKETDLHTWFDQAGLSRVHLGYTGLFMSMTLYRGTKR
ncbi:MAG: methyltransferase domain-containing protein [Candidatus Latescibacterota bacterium]|nr:methyltransferase domain-containing protein [Candidatus Latescibacterota bacterium]